MFCAVGPRVGGAATRKQASELVRRWRHGIWQTHLCEAADEDPVAMYVDMV